MHNWFRLNILLLSVELLILSTSKRDKKGRPPQAISLFNADFMTLIALGGYCHEFLEVIISAVVKCWCGESTQWTNKHWEEMLWRTDRSKAQQTVALFSLRVCQSESNSLCMNIVVTLSLHVFGTCSWRTVFDVHLHRCIFTDALWLWRRNPSISMQTGDFHNEPGFFFSWWNSVVEVVYVLHGFNRSAEYKWWICLWTCLQNGNRGNVKHTH